MQHHHSSTAFLSVLSYIPFQGGSRRSGLQFCQYLQQLFLMPSHQLAMSKTKAVSCCCQHLSIAAANEVLATEHLRAAPLMDAPAGDCDASLPQGAHWQLQIPPTAFATSAMGDMSCCAWYCCSMQWLTGCDATAEPQEPAEAPGSGEGAACQWDAPTAPLLTAAALLSAQAPCCCFAPPQQPRSHAPATAVASIC